jgi:hypothetical protein
MVAKCRQIGTHSSPAHCSRCILQAAMNIRPFIDQGDNSVKHIIEKQVRDLRNLKHLLISLLVGSLTGAAIMLLFAPQSGRRTRANLYQRSILMGNRGQMNHVSSTIKVLGVPVKVTPVIMRPALLTMVNKGSKIRYSSFMPKTENQLLIEELLANDSLGG